MVRLVTQKGLAMAARAGIARRETCGQILTSGCVSCVGEKRALRKSTSPARRRCFCATWARERREMRGGREGAGRGAGGGRGRGRGRGRSRGQAAALLPSKAESSYSSVRPWGVFSQWWGLKTIW
ncbi:hypothetical protein GCM10011399_03190 [Subtercola lobariae]|uniref:Uncharacterized protein n=1 Tax=Subtercola lobariae TaxID=1588641 RepID=A0A917B0C4_9MICO|nr:hypothetical protein GCM10011399_03190 [Subtercola lobariae]